MRLGVWGYEEIVLGIDIGIPDGTWRASIKQVRILCPLALLTLILIDTAGYLKAFGFI